MPGSTRRQFVKRLSMASSVCLAKYQSIAFLPQLGFLASAGFAETTLKPLFEEVPVAASGLTWRHENGRSADYFLPETTGAGCAFLDYDNDGWMDIYLVNSGKCDFLTPDPPLGNALYRNNRDGTFTEVTEKAGVAAGGYGMGVAVGDYDADGWPDLYVTQYGRSILYHNNGNGTFTDVTEKAGLAAPGWASSAVWFDYDNDGRLDLFVCRFVDFDKSKNKFCGNEKTGERFYCIPRIYPPAASWLFHNNGDGTFADVSKESGIAKALGKAWGVVATDINNDGWMDLFVANDTVANFLFVNKHNGKFDEKGLEAGVAYSQSGRERSGMGVDSADFDQDGWQDLFVTNVDQEMYSIYRNNHDLTFDDWAGSMGLGRLTRLMSGWGVKFFAVVVVVKEFHSPAAHEARQPPEPHGAGPIVEREVVIVAVDGVHFLVHVGNEEILPTVLVEIRRVNSHAGALAARLAVSHARFEPLLIELSVVFVDEEKVGDRVVGHEEIHPAVVVDIRGNDTPGFSQRLGDAGFLADVGERTVPVVVEEPARCRRVDTRDAIEAFSGLVVATEFVLGFVKVHEAANE